MEGFWPSQYHGRDEAAAVIGVLVMRLDHFSLAAKSAILSLILSFCGRTLLRKQGRASGLRSAMGVMKSPPE